MIPEYDLICCDICAIEVPILPDNLEEILEGDSLTFSSLDNVKPIGYKKIPVHHYIGNVNVSHDEWINANKKKKKIEPQTRQLQLYLVDG